MDEQVLHASRLRRKFLELADVGTRKLSTFGSILNSAVRMAEDGNDPRRIDHHERLRYLELRRALSWKKGIVVYDVGASVGTFATFVARLDTVAAVCCFEPVAGAFTELEHNCRPFYKVRCYPCALGDRRERATLHVNRSSACSSFLPTLPIHEREFPESGTSLPATVEVHTLDRVIQEFGLPPPDFIKLDVQGFESLVLAGAPSTLAMIRHCLIELSLVSLYEGSALIEEMNATMRGFGFRLVSILRRPVVGVTGEILQIDGLYEKAD